MSPAFTNDKTTLELFKQSCLAKGIKLTHQRIEIFRELALSEEHPDADTVLTRVRKRIPTISRDTVYRNLKFLSEQGLIAIVGMSHERLRFDANMKSHHHFVCIRCGLIRDFYSNYLTTLEYPKEVEIFGKPLSLHIEVKGLCTKCASHRKKKREYVVV